MSLGPWIETGYTWLCMLWKKFLRNVRSCPLWEAYAQNIVIRSYWAFTFKHARRLENDKELRMHCLTHSEMMKPTSIWCATSLSSLDKTTQSHRLWCIDFSYWYVFQWCTSHHELSSKLPLCDKRKSRHHAMLRRSKVQILLLRSGHRLCPS